MRVVGSELVFVRLHASMPSDNLGKDVRLDADL